MSATMLLASCSFGSSSSGAVATSYEDSIPVGSGSDYESVVIDSNLSGTQSYSDSSFTMTTEDGSFNVSGSTITILSGGTYTLKGTWNGVICGDLGDEDVVELDLNGVTLSNDANSCIYFLNADKLKVKSMEGTTNAIVDGRAIQTVEDESQGGGALYSKCDTNLVGYGTLNVTGTFNNGVHVTKDLTVKNVTLNVTAPNNVLKGNDSVTIESGTISLTSSGGDGIKTVDSDISDNGNQRGTIDIQGGSITISSAYDGMDAAYDLNVSGGDIDIRTNAYRTSSSTKTTTRGGPGGGNQGGPGGTTGGGGGGIPGGTGTSSEKAEDSAKGMKAANQIVISGGSIDIAAYDDAIHANNDNALENGSTPLGNVTISDGTLNLIASDDGIHADGTLAISGGTTTVEEAYEGLEGKYVNVSGGTTVAYASDDAVNAGYAINVSGGYLFGAVPNSGDCDGIDSNGTITVTGGVLIGCGPNSEMASPYDCDGTISVKGGTLMAFGYGPRISSSVTSSSKSGSYGNKAYTVKFANGSVDVANLPYSYSGCYAWSSLGSISSIS